MMLDDALEIVIARTNHERYRWLCSDDNSNISQRDGYRVQVLLLAGYEFPPLPIIPLPDLRTFRHCLYASDFVAGCCSAPATVRCHWLNQTICSATCTDCLKDVT